MKVGLVMPPKNKNKIVTTNDPLITGSSPTAVWPCGRGHRFDLMADQVWAAGQIIGDNFSMEASFLLDALGLRRGPLMMDSRLRGSWFLSRVPWAALSAMHWTMSCILGWSGIGGWVSNRTRGLSTKDFGFVL